MPYMFDIDFILLKNLQQIMFNEYSTYYVSKKRFSAFFPFKTM